MKLRAPTCHSLSVRRCFGHERMVRRADVAPLWLAFVARSRDYFARAVSALTSFDDVDGRISKVLFQSLRFCICCKKCVMGALGYAPLVVVYNSVRDSRANSDRKREFCDQSGDPPTPNCDKRPFVPTPPSPRARWHRPRPRVVDDGLPPLAPPVRVLTPPPRPTPGAQRRLPWAKKRPGTPPGPHKR